VIALTLPARSEGTANFVVRLCDNPERASGEDAVLVDRGARTSVYASPHGLFELVRMDESAFDGDVVSVDPVNGKAERLIRRNSPHNTFLVTERCDQLCVMCSQPPKKTHVDRWAEFTEAALLAPQDTTIGISGGEPTLYKSELFDMIETVSAVRLDLAFHVLSNAQHFDRADCARLGGDAFRRVTWGVPLYSHKPSVHDAIVAKSGALANLRDGLAVLLEAGAHVELRTVIMKSNLRDLTGVANYVTNHLGFVDQWSIMQLENIGFARRRFNDFMVDTLDSFGPIAEAIDRAELFGIATALFNFPRCQVPAAYRRYAVKSISDWKQKYAPECTGCADQSDCSGFFAWHPDEAMKVYPS
jgi:His-Xaa-Ser system radical SAM maturase HxsC